MPEITTSAGARIAYHDSGTGPALLFLHSFGHNRNLWAPQLDHFVDRGWRVVAPDMPGHGASPLNPGRCSVEAMAADYLELVDRLGLDRPVLVSASMGGYIGLRMWGLRPGVFRALVLSNTKAEADSPEIVGRRHEQIRNIGEKGLEWFVETGAPRRLSPATVARKPWVVDTVKLLNLTVGAEANAATLQAMAERADDTQVLATIDAPTLVIAGADDAFIPKGSAAALRDGIASAELVEIADTGHVTSLEAPDRFNRAVEAFLAASAAPMRMAHVQ